MIPTPDQQPTMTVEEAGAVLGLGRSAAYSAVARGEIPVLQFGRRLVVPTASLRRLLGIDDEPPTPTSAPDLRLVP